MTQPCTGRGHLAVAIQLSTSLLKDSFLLHTMPFAAGFPPAPTTQSVQSAGTEDAALRYARRGQVDRHGGPCALEDVFSLAIPYCSSCNMT